MPLGPNSFLLYVYTALTMLIPLAVVALVVYYASRAGVRRALAAFQPGGNKDNDGERSPSQ